MTRRGFAVAALVAASSLLTLALSVPAQAAPYISCPGGYIVYPPQPCPPLQKHYPGGQPPTGGGSGSVLGNLLDGLGLGALGGLGGIL